MYISYSQTTFWQNYPSTKKKQREREIWQINQEACWNKRCRRSAFSDGKLDLDRTRARLCNILHPSTRIYWRICVHICAIKHRLEAHVAWYIRNSCARTRAFRDRTKATIVWNIDCKTDCKAFLFAKRCRDASSLDVRNEHLLYINRNVLLGRIA